MVQCSDGRNVHYDFDEDSIVAIGVTEQAALEFTCTYGEKEYEAVCYVTVVEALE